MKTLYFYLSILLFVVISCSRQDDEVAKKTLTYDVYVVGRENNEACYWKNGIKTVLSGGTGYQAWKMFIDNNDVYVLGSDQNLQTYETNYYYWKNNVKYSIAQSVNAPLNTNTQKFFTMSDFFVKNGDVYIAGTIANSISSNPQLYSYEYCYWKNGTKTVVFQQQSPSYNNGSYYLNGADNYVFLYTPSSNWDFGYYKNGTYSFVGNNLNYRSIHLVNNSPKMLITDELNQTIFYKDLSSGVISPVPSFITYNTPYFNLVNDGNDQYYWDSGIYYKNNNPISNPNNNGYVMMRDFWALNGNIFILRAKDSNNFVGEKVYVNGVETQSISLPNGEFHSLYVIAH